MSKLHKIAKTSINASQNTGDNRNTNRFSVSRIFHTHNKCQRVFFIFHKTGKHSIGFFATVHFTGTGFCTHREAGEIFRTVFCAHIIFQMGNSGYITSYP